MNWQIILVHVFLSVLLFAIINWIGKHASHAGYMSMSVLYRIDQAPAFNFVYRAYAPVVCMVLCAWLFVLVGLDELTTNLYLIVVYYFSLRLAVALVKGQSRLLNWGQQVLLWIVSIGSAVYIYGHIIANGDLMLPEGKELSLAVWLGVIAFLYKTINSTTMSDHGTRQRKARHVSSRFGKFRKEYGELIRSIATDSQEEPLVYAILVYEDFQRPWAYRLIENILFRLGIAKTLGVMQVTTKKLISDRESVTLGAKRLVSSFRKHKSKARSGEIPEHCQWKWDAYSIRHGVLTEYNPDGDYGREVNELFAMIVQKHFPEQSDEKLRASLVP